MTLHFVIGHLVPALIVITITGGLSSLITTPVQMLLMAKAHEAPTMAAASNHSAFNLANAGGAWLGGLVIAAGWGWSSPTLVGAALAVVGLALAATGGYLDRERRASKVVLSSTGGGTDTAGQDRPAAACTQDPSA
ncbi:MFS transporter OS=Streptomyces tendae OX=1932 GN=F3L20_18120 PE=4 SV=1 [Streptomyces tendae]